MLVLFQNLQISPFRASKTDTFRISRSIKAPIESSISPHLPPLILPPRISALSSIFMTYTLTGLPSITATAALSHPFFLAHPLPPNLFDPCPCSPPHSPRATSNLLSFGLCYNRATVFTSGVPVAPEELAHSLQLTPVMRAMPDACAAVSESIMCSIAYKSASGLIHRLSCAPLTNHTSKSPMEVIT